MSLIKKRHLEVGVNTSADVDWLVRLPKRMFCYFGDTSGSFHRENLSEVVTAIHKMEEKPFQPGGPSGEYRSGEQAEAQTP